MLTFEQCIGILGIHYFMRDEAPLQYSLFLLEPRVAPIQLILHKSRFKRATSPRGLRLTHKGHLKRIPLNPQSCKHPKQRILTLVNGSTVGR